MQPVLDRLAAELEKPRALTAQTLRHLAATYGIDRQEVGTFLDERLAGLEEDELDLTLSALYTPKLADQSIFADLLESASVTRADLHSWVEYLLQRPTTGHLQTADGVTHAFPLQRVTLERYVFRLRLEGTLPEGLLRLIRSLPPRADQPRLLAIARRAVWNTPDRWELLQRFLARNYAGNSPIPGNPEDVLAVPFPFSERRAANVLARLPAWEQVVRIQVSSADQPSPFFNERVQDLHGGGRDQRGVNETLRQQKQSELAFLGRLGSLLAA